MEKEQVIKLRNAFGKDNLKVICDNEQIFLSGMQGTYILWDDDNCIIFRTATTNNYYDQSKKPIEVLATTYENIQYIGKSVSGEDYNNLLDGVITQGIFTEDEVKNSRKYYNDKYNKNRL